MSKVFTLKYNANETYLVDTKYDLRSVSRYESYMDFETRLIRPITNISMHWQLFTCYNDCHPFLVNITFSLCSLDGKSGNFYINSIYRSSSRTQTNLLPAKCPLREGFYYMRNSSISANTFNLLPIPDNTYKVVYTVYINEGNLKIFLLRLQFKFVLYHTNQTERKSIGHKKH